MTSHVNHQNGGVKSGPWALMVWLGTSLFYLFGFLIVFGLVGLSFWAVGSVQLESRAETDPLRYWYLAMFLIAEGWVAVGFTLLARRLSQKVYGAAFVAFLLWVPAVGLSAYQEWRFHTLRNADVELDKAPDLAKRESALTREPELLSALAAIGETRPTDAIQAELDRYEPRPEIYPTKISSLKSELATAQERQKLELELGTVRQTLTDTAALSVNTADAKKLGIAFTIPGIGIHVPETFAVWVVIGWAMAIKAFGPWLLLGSGRNKPDALNVEPDTSGEAETAHVPEEGEGAPLPSTGQRWVTKIDRHGNPRRVRVFS